MSDYTLSAKITGDSKSFESAFIRAQNKMKSFDKKVKNMGANISSSGKNMMKFGSKVSLMTAPLLLLGKSALKTGMQFESSMSQVAATMGITKDEIAKGSKSFDMLEKAARESGKVTQYSASESAEALNYLALAGYNAEQAIETLPKVLNLASAGGLDLAYTSDLITDSASALGLEIDDLDGFIDQMARTSQKSNTNVGQLGEAILKVGANARDLKGGTLELNTAIGLLGNVGLKGSEAGTKLRNVIMAMTPTTDAAVAAFKALGVQTYDANGELKGLDNIFTDLNKSMANMTTEEKKRMISSIFNKQDMAAALSLLASTAQSTDDLNFALEELGVPMKDIDMNMDNLVGKVSEYGDEQEFASFAMKEFGLTAEQSGILYNTLSEAIEGDSAWNNLAKEIKNSDGAAQDMSDTLNDNLEGDVKRMGSAFSEFQIALYKTSNGAMSDFIVKVTEIINKLSSLDSSTLQIITAIAGIALIAGPTIVILGAIATTFGTLISAGAAIAGALLSPIGLVVTAIVGLGIAIGIAMIKSEIFREKVLGVFQTIRDFIMGVVSAISPTLSNMWNEAKQGVSSFADSLGDKLLNAFQVISNVVTTVVSTIVSTFMPTFNIVKTAIMDIAAVAIPLVVNGFMTLVNIIMSVGQAVMNIASAVFPVLLGIFNQLVPIISDIVVIFMDIGTQVMSMASTLISRLMPVITTLVTTVMNIVQTVAPAVIAIINVIIAVIKAIIPVILTIISTVINVVSNVISVITPMIAFIGLVINTIMAIITPIVVFVANIIAAIVRVIGTIIGIVTGIFNTVFTVISGVFSSVSSFISGVINRISSTISTISSTVSSVFNKVYSIASSIMNRVGSVINGVFAGIQNAWNGLTGFVSGVFSGISSSVSQLVGQVKGFVNGVIGGINAAIGLINKIPGVSIGKIPKLYRGTDDWPGGFARMNEGGRGELTYLPNGTVVVPHDISMKYAKESARINNFEGNTENIGGNQYINVSLDSANIYDTRDIREISREIAQEISREVSLG